MRTLFWWAILVSGTISIAHADGQPLAGARAQNSILSDIVVLSPKWSSQVPPTGRVNAPEFFSVLYPGQPIAFGLMAEGPDRDTLFANITVDARFTTGTSTVKEFHRLRPVAVRSLKAEGADFALLALDAGGINGADRSKLETATTFATLAVFAPDWSVPAGDQATDVTISVTVSGTPVAATIAPARRRIRTTQEWLKASPPTEADLGRQMTRYHSALAPGELLSWFQALATTPSMNAAPVQWYFAYALKSNGAARAAIVDAFPRLDARVQPPLLWILRAGGQDLRHLLPDVAPGASAALAGVEPLEDPPRMLHFQDPVTPEAMKRLGQPMDQCWAAWMATGDKHYLRSLVDLLGGASSYPAFKAWQESRGGAKGLNAQVATGLEYQIAGWSIGSFQRTDPLVMDWLLYWQNDPTVPATIRREIASLPTNPAFQRK